MVNPGDNVINPPKVETQEEIEARIRAKVEAELKAKIESDLLAKIENDKKEIEKQSAETALLEKIKKMTEQKDADIAKVDDKIKMSNMEAKYSEAMELVKQLSERLDNEAKEKTQMKVKNEILQRLDKEPYLKDVVGNYLNTGLINSIEDYDKIVNADLKKSLKEIYDIKERNKASGRDPLANYSSNSVNNQSIDWKKAAEAKYGDEIKKKLGIKI